MKFIIVTDGYLYSWRLEGKDGPICQSAGGFDSVDEARSNIAKVKKAMAGAKFAKVVGR